MSLKLHDNDLLMNILDGDNYDALMKLLVSLAERQGEDVLKCDVKNGPQDMLIAKANFDGANKIIRQLAKYRERLFKEAKNA